MKKKIKCPKCAKALIVDESGIPRTGAVITCRSCGAKFRIKPRKTSANSPKTDDATGEGHVACPACGKRQPKAESCAFCGIVFSKYKRSRPCPRCATQLPLDAAVCHNCQYRLFGPPKKRRDFRSLHVAVTGTENIEKARKGVVGFVGEFIIDNIRSTSFVIVIVVLVTIIVGKTPFFSILFEEDKEVMYTGDCDDCRRMKQFIEGDMPLLRLKVANMGRDNIEKIRLTVRELPYPMVQIYHTVLNVSADEVRSHDPKVTLACSGGDFVECPKMKAMMNFQEVCGILYTTQRQYEAEYGYAEEEYSADDQERFDGFEQRAEAEFERRARMEQDRVAMDARKEAEERGRKHDDWDFHDPCAGQAEGPGPSSRQFVLSDLAPGALVKIGLAAHGGDWAEYDYNDLRNVRIEVETPGDRDCEIVSGDPQAAALARFFKRVIELF